MLGHSRSLEGVAQVRIDEDPIVCDGSRCHRAWCVRHGLLLNATGQFRSSSHDKSGEHLIQLIAPLAGFPAAATDDAGPLAAIL
jgi:hypothetical protein